MLSAIVTDGEVAEVFFLIALIVFVIAAVLAFNVKTLWATLLSVGAAFLAAGFLWL